MDDMSMDSMQMDDTSAINMEEYDAVFKGSTGDFLVPEYYSLTHLKFFNNDFSQLVEKEKDGYRIESQSILLDALPIIPISELCKSENVSNALSKPYTSRTYNSC